MTRVVEVKDLTAGYLPGVNILNVQIRMRANLPQFAGGPEGSAFTVDYQHAAVILLNRKKAVMTGT